MNRIQVLIAVTLFSAATTARAGSLPFSRPGLIDIPTASVLQHTEVELGGSFTAFSYENADSTSESDFAIAGHLEVGLFNRAQIGITWLGSAGLSGNARVIALRETSSIPAIAIGCQNITGEQNYEFFRDSNDSLYTYEEEQNFAAYIVLTKSLDYYSGIPMCINLGYGIGRFRQGKNSDSDGISNPFRGLFGGIEYHPARNVSLMLEWDGRDAAFGAEYTLNSNVRFLFAVSELEQLAMSNRDPSDVMQNVKISFGAEFTLGPFLNRTTLEPFEELTQDQNEDLLLELERLRMRAKEEIEELERDIP